MNTIASYALGDRVTLTERFTNKNQRINGRPAQYTYVRVGVVVELDGRVRVKWDCLDTYLDGSLVATREWGGKRTWVAPDRLTIVA